MSSILPANRVAAIAAFLTGLASFISGITQSLPSAWQNYALAAVGVIGSVLTVLHFMSGSQKFDALTLGKLAGGVVKQVESGIGIGTSGTTLGNVTIRSNTLGSQKQAPPADLGSTSPPPESARRAEPPADEPGLGPDPAGTLPHPAGG